LYFDQNCYVQIATGEELDAQRLSTLIIEIHKFAPVEYRGTLVCRWMEFLHWVGVESYNSENIACTNTPKPDKGKKKKAKYVPKKYKKKKGGGVYDMESDKKKKGRRR
jgi:hypothetical protein